MADQVKIFVYGSCYYSSRVSDNSVGDGGYGVVICVNGKRTDELSGGSPNTTNARMEIIGITEGIERVKEPSNIIVYLNNDYIISTLTKGWLKKWKKKGFKKIKHPDLWVKLDKVICANTHSISFQHSGDFNYSDEFKQAKSLAKAISGKSNPKGDRKARESKKSAPETIDDKPILDSICVDASSIKNPGPTEYRGVDTRTKKELFRFKLGIATINIGEFLAIVHALARFKRNGEVGKIIYSDSRNAISWVKQKKCKTQHEKTDANAKLFELIERAETWLLNNDYDTKVLKWNTRAWGEIPADFGRK